MTPRGPRWTPMNSAFYDVDSSLMVTNRDPGTSMRITTTWSVLEHDRGVVVIDTGVDPRVASAISSADSVASGQAMMARGADVTTRLSALGVVPSDVRYVINTHLHLDHTGANRELVGATFLIRAPELEYARRPDDPLLALEYDQAQIAESELSYVSVDGVHDVFGDACVTLYPSPGHSAGHQSVLVRLRESAPILITGDAIWTRDNIREMTLPGVLWSRPVYVASRRRLLGLARARGARLFFTHEPTTFDDEGWEEGVPLS